MTQATRRDMLMAAFAAATTTTVVGGARADTGRPVPPARLVSTSDSLSFAESAEPVRRASAFNLLDVDVIVREDAPAQTIRGFGGCFNELGWVALQATPTDVRERLVEELFSPGVGADFSVCRLPIGASDFARGWYSFDETPNDFAMTHFSIDRDREMLMPFIKAAKAKRADLSLWASPWSPPTWMKKNGHYACAQTPVPSWPANGLRADQVCHEGADAFILEDRYLEAYALYFRRFVEAYRAEGLSIGAVMPQNEFNSAQPFPSCCWTPEGLARFIPHLGRQMSPLGVDVLFGTLERADDRLFERVWADPDARPYIKGVAAQWAGRRAIPFIHHAHPELPVVQSEQECGDGANDWRFARYTFTLMKEFLQAGAEVYEYWSLAAPKGGVSTWGWPQNALISVDLKTGEATLNPDYFVLKQLTHFVRPGAVRLDTLSFKGFDDQLAFRNPDGGLVLFARNAGAKAQPIRVLGRGALHTAVLPPDSISTLTF